MAWNRNTACSTAVSVSLGKQSGGAGGGTGPPQPTDAFVTGAGLGHTGQNSAPLMNSRMSQLPALLPSTSARVSRLQSAAKPAAEKSGSLAFLSAGRNTATSQAAALSQLGGLSVNKQPSKWEKNRKKESVCLGLGRDRPERPFERQGSGLMLVCGASSTHNAQSCVPEDPADSPTGTALPSSCSRPHRCQRSAYLWVSVMHHHAQAQPPYTYCFTSEPQQPPAGESTEVEGLHGHSRGKTCSQTEPRAEQLPSEAAQPLGAEERAPWSGHRNQRY